LRSKEQETRLIFHELDDDDDDDCTSCKADQTCQRIRLSPEQYARIFVQRCILHIDTRGWSGIIYRRMPQVARGRGISRVKAVLKDEHKVREIRFGD
jgi:hypothetical protein